MLRNYFTISIRIFKNQPVYTVINVFGLGLGLACCIVTFIFLSNELSYDSFHKKKNQLYKLVTSYKTDQGDIRHDSRSVYPLADAIRRDLPEFGSILQIQGPYENTISYTDTDGNFKIFKEQGTIYVSEQFFEMLSFNILRGAGGEILSEPNKVFLTERLAAKYFSDEDPIGKMVRLQNDSSVAEVVGIIENPPLNSSLPFDLLISYKTFANRYPNIHENWKMTWVGSLYIEFGENQDLSVARDRLNSILPKYIGDEDAAKYKLDFLPITKIHTADEYGYNTFYTIPHELIYTLIVLSILLIGTACLNFINLATALATKRGKEIGIRKTIGGNKKQLVIQFMLETVLVVTLSSIFALTVAQIFLFVLNDYLSQYTIFDLQITFESILFLVPLIITVTFMAGFYPSLIVSGYDPVDALKNRISVQKGSGSYFLRKGLVLAQFCFSLLMLVSLIIITSQMQFLSNTEMGFNREQVIHLKVPTNAAKSDKVAAFRGELLKLSYVFEASKSFGPPVGGSSWNTSFKKLENEYEDGMRGSLRFVDENYVKTWDIELAHGDGLIANEVNDSTFHVLVNKKFLEKIEFTPEEAIGKRFGFNNNLYGIIDGVTENFNTNSLKVTLRPAILAYRPDYFSGIDVKVEGKHFLEVQPQLETIFHEFFPRALFEYVDPEDAIRDSYALEEFVYHIIQVFSIISVIISVIGLYGLVSYMVARNSKMIGVRKVFGASTMEILRLFIWDYFILLGIAFLLASPLAYYIMDMFLSSFVYHISLSVWYFLLAFLMIVVIAILTVGWKTYHSAIQNPAHSLRYE